MAGTAAPALVDFLNQARRCDPKWVVVTAIDALGEIRSCNGADVEVLRRELDSSPAVSAGSLMAYGSLAQSASGDLHPLLTNDDPRIRCAAAATIARNESDVHAAGILVDLAVEGDQYIRHIALARLGDVRDLDERAYSRLRLLIDDPEKGVSALAKTLNDSDRSARLAAAYFIRGYGPLAIATAPLFRDWLVTADPTTRIEAARALARIAPSDEAIAAMVSLLDAPRPEVRKGAALALDEFASLPGWVIAPLQKLQRDSDPDVAQAGTFVLNEITSRGAVHDQ